MTGNKPQFYEALLIDLDGTLLDLDLENFAFTYVNALSKKFKDLINHEDFIRHLFGSTGAMINNVDPSKKNQTVFYDDFCQRIGLSYDHIKPIIDDFYRHDFPNLSRWGKEHPYAQRVVAEARRKGMTLILATNPVFPCTAVLQRLSWGGLSENDFQLITSMENMHYCKPKPQYYLEISQKINCSPERCLMAGNDTLEDLIASETGMATYLVEDSILHSIDGEPVSDYRGRLKDLAVFIENM
jgi:FMN phosphatase YigB (HAD superfamily)